jgi:hypothetical protein
MLGTSGGANKKVKAMLSTSRIHFVDTVKEDSQVFEVLVGE